MRKHLLAGLSAFALVTALSGAAWAAGADLYSSNPGSAAGVNGSEIEGIGGGSTFGASDALAVNALSQVSASALTSGSIDSVLGDMAGDMSYSDHAFQNETASQNNFASAINATQQGAVAIAGAVSNH